MSSSEKNDFKVNIKLETFYGKYDWCCVNGISGYTLSVNPKQSSCSYSKIGQMVKIDIFINQELLDKIDIIEMYDKTNFLAQYSVEKLKNKNSFFFQLQYVNTKESETVLNILFRKILPRKVGRFTLCRPPMQTILSEKITIPILNFKGDIKCAICLEEVDDDKYISKCKHLFHNKCIFNYIKFNDFINKLSKKCQQHCQHSEKPKPFPCPICRTILEDNK